jgi:hypothetical protein
MLCPRPICAPPVSGGFFMSTKPQRFGSSCSTFLASDVSGTSNAVITDPGNHANTLTLVGVAPSSLSQANFHFS